MVGFNDVCQLFIENVFHVDRKGNLNENIYGQPAECFLLELSIIFPEFQRRTTSQSSRRAAHCLSIPPSRGAQGGVNSKNTHNHPKAMRINRRSMNNFKTSSFKLMNKDS